MKRSNGGNGNKVGLADGIAVALIFLVLWAILLPVFSQTHCARYSWRMRSLSNLKQLGLALAMYAQDYDERLPPLPDAVTARRRLDPYLKNDAVWREPKTGRPYEVNRALSGARLARFAKTTDRLVVFYEGGADKRGFRGATFLDGHARIINEETWRESKRVSRIATTADECLAALDREAERENRPRFFLLGLPVNCWGVFVLIVQVILPALFFRVFAPRRPARS